MLPGVPCRDTGCWAAPANLGARRRLYRNAGNGHRDAERLCTGHDACPLSGESSRRRVDLGHHDDVGARLGRDPDDVIDRPVVSARDLGCHGRAAIGRSEIPQPDCGFGAHESVDPGPSLPGRPPSWFQVVRSGNGDPRISDGTDGLQQLRPADASGVAVEIRDAARVAGADC